MRGDAEFERMLATIRALPELGKRAAPDVATAIENELRRTIAAGTAPDGTPWKPTQEGETPLRNAAAAMGVAAVGPTIYVRLTGPEARHHIGSARGGVRRQVIPGRDGLPPVMAAAVRVVLTRHFQELVRGVDG